MYNQLRRVFMRASGILMHISSLPNEYGIGKLGREAYEFVDFLASSKQSYWQILPISPTSYGDSPYQSFSIFAGNPYFIDLEQLEIEGLLEPEDYKGINWGEKADEVDYGAVYDNIFSVLKKAYIRFTSTPQREFESFIKKNSWVNDYGLFMSLKFANGGKAWYQWEDGLRLCKSESIKKARERYSDEIRFWIFLQYKFFKQWRSLKKYANKKGIKIIGDIPIYVALDSVEVWRSPKYFLLDKNKTPIDVAGCPPDYFSPLGQLWGNPLYRWDVMEADGFKWWIKRIKFATSIYDVIRIDHFRGFDSYYAIKFGSKDATVGEWRKGVGIKLFKEVEKKLGKLNIIAEDLGFITKSVERLLRQSEYPGMKVLEFAFYKDGKSQYLPHNYPNKNSIVYTGTHDNETIVGWISSQTKEDIAFCKRYLGVKRNKDIPWEMIRLAWSSVSDTAIAQMQDFLGLGKSSRMNTPSTVGNNWRWRMQKGALTNELSERIAELTDTYDRNRRNDKEEKKNG